MSALDQISTDVILRDGSTLRLRAPLAADADSMLEFISGLSEHSRYLRFHGFPALGPKLVAPFLDPDWDERGALIGCHEGRMVALANFVRLRERRAAEVAFTVADDFQGRGMGTRLLERLAELAAEAGIESFVAEVLPENQSMLVVFRDAGFELTRELDGGAVEVALPDRSRPRTTATRRRAEPRRRASPRSARSSSPSASPSSARPHAAARSAASSSATSSRPTSPAPPTP